MYLIIVLAALGFLQIWTTRNPLHYDGWFERWQDWLHKRLPERWPPWTHMALAILTPALLVAVSLYNLPGYFAYPLMFIVLLYCLGRGEFAAQLDAYRHACSDNDWEDAVEAASQQGADVELIRRNDWSQLHQKVLEAVAYQGFERLFAVLFWFVFFGAGGALLYRLSYLYQQRHDQPLASRWLWGLEWPAVRLLSLSLAVTGNFVGCINRWKAYVFCQSSASRVVLRETVLGALSVDDELVESCDCTQREVAALHSLYTRTLWFWVCVLAIWTIMY